jgi:CRISPR/Cas system-associated endonuclease Cas1
MRKLYLLRPHGTAALDGEQLVVRSHEEEFDRLAVPLLDQIMVLGKTQLTMQ